MQLCVFCSTYLTNSQIKIFMLTPKSILHAVNDCIITSNVEALKGNLLSLTMVLFSVWKGGGKILASRWKDEEQGKIEYGVLYPPVWSFDLLSRIFQKTYFVKIRDLSLIFKIKISRIPKWSASMGQAQLPYSCEGGGECLICHFGKSLMEEGKCLTMCINGTFNLDLKVLG